MVKNGLQCLRQILYYYDLLAIQASVSKLFYSSCWHFHEHHELAAECAGGRSHPSSLTAKTHHQYWYLQQKKKIFKGASATMYVNHGQHQERKVLTWCVLLTFCQQYRQIVDATTRDGILLQAYMKEYPSLIWSARLWNPNWNRRDMLCLFISFLFIMSKKSTYQQLWDVPWSFQFWFFWWDPSLPDL